MSKTITAKRHVSRRGVASLVNIAALSAAAASLPVFNGPAAGGSATLTDELRGLLDQQQKAWADFRNENDKRLKEIEKYGTESATTRQNVENLSTKMDEIKASLDKAAKRADAMEATVNLINMHGGASNLANVSPEKAAQNIAIFNAITGRQASQEQYANYCKAWNRWLRRGDVPHDGEYMNALSVGSEPNGGYWVAPDRTGPIVQKLYETSPMRQVALVVSITTDAIEGVVDNDEATSGWVSEKQERTETNTPDVGKYRIPVWEQYAEPRITQQLLDDAAFDTEGWLGAKVSNKLSRTETTAFISGNGSAKPRGFLDYSIVSTGDATRAWNAIQYIASGADGAFASTHPSDKLFDMIYALKAPYRTGAAWMTAKATLGTIRKFKDTTGQYLWQPGLQPGQPSMLAGYPVAEAEDMPAIASNSYSLAFGNFREAYIIVDRQGVRVLRDPFTAKPYVKFYTTKRVGGGLVNGEAIKVMKFAAS